MKCSIFVCIVCMIIFVEATKTEKTTESVEEKRPRNKNGGNIPFDPKNPPKKSKQLLGEIAAGSVADIFPPNEHFAMTDMYKNLGRRFIPQYPYYEKEKQAVQDKKAEDILHKIIQDSRDKYESEDIKLLPVKASPEFVLAVAKQSKLLEDSKPINPTEELIAKESLRSGDYWDGVWKEEVNPNILRTGDVVQQRVRPKKKVDPLPRLGSVKTKIMPGTKLYQLISVLRRVSPKFLYVMNVN